MTNPDQMNKKREGRGKGEIPVSVPQDANPKGSKDPADQGDNGNPAQSAGRLTAEEQNAHPASFSDPTAGDPELMPDSLPETGKT